VSTAREGAFGPDSGNPGGWDSGHGSDPDQGSGDTEESATLNLAVTGTVECGNTEEIYENLTHKAKCKTFQVKNTCKQVVTLKVSDGTEATIAGSKTKAYDLTIDSRDRVDLECGLLFDDRGACCTYTIESCAD